MSLFVVSNEGGKCLTTVTSDTDLIHYLEGYKDLVERLVLDNQIEYSDVPYDLRIKNIGIFFYAVREARDGLQDASCFVSIMAQFLQDIDTFEQQNGENMRLRRRAIDAILGVNNLFTGVRAYDEFIHQQKRIRPWLFEN